MTVQVCGISDFSLVVFEILMKQIEKIFWIMFNVR
jgi:hypothetical protein